MGCGDRGLRLEIDQSHGSVGSRIEFTEKKSTYPLKSAVII